MKGGAHPLQSGTAPTVIPAKAGIHCADIGLPDGWIPAFAGMTMEGERRGKREVSDMHEANQVRR
jgi:hypothetical protein